MEKQSWISKVGQNPQAQKEPNHQQWNYFTETQGKWAGESAVWALSWRQVFLSWRRGSGVSVAVHSGDIWTWSSSRLGVHPVHAKASGSGSLGTAVFGQRLDLMVLGVFSHFTVLGFWSLLMLCGKRTEELFNQEYCARGGAQYPGSSQNPRTVGVGRDLWKSPSARAGSRWVWNDSRGGGISHCFVK